MEAGGPGLQSLMTAWTHGTLSQQQTATYKEIEEKKRKKENGLWAFVPALTAGHYQL